MNAYELVERLDGEIVRGQARWRSHERGYVVLAKLNGDDLTLTDVGRDLARDLDAGVDVLGIDRGEVTLDAAPKPEPEPQPKKPAPKKAAPKKADPLKTAAATNFFDELNV